MIECTVFADRGLVRLSGLVPNGTATVTRIAPGVPDTVLRNGYQFPVVASGVILEDSEAPVGVPLTYYADISVNDRVIQQNLLPTPSFMHGAQGWVAGAGRTLTIEGDPTAQHSSIGHFSNNAAGSALAAPPTLVGHADATPETGGTITLTPATTGGSAIANGDWVYIVYQQLASAPNPTAPSGFTQVLAAASPQLEVWVWRRKRVAGDAGYTITADAGAAAITSAFWVRGAGDQAPILSPVAGFQIGMASAVVVQPTTAINPSLVVTVEATVTAAAGALIGSALVSGATYGWAVGNDPDTRSMLVATEALTNGGNSSKVTAVYSATVADVLSWQLVIGNATPLTNRVVAKAKITALSAAAAAVNPYRMTGRFRFTSTNVWLWDDVKNNGSWDDLLADKATWADVLSTVVPGLGEYSRLFAAVVNPADGSYYVQPVQVLGFEDTRANTWLDFVIYFTPKADIPATAEIWFMQGAAVREFSIEWYLDSLGITPGDQLAKHTTVWYLDGDTPRPAGAASAMDPTGNWTTPLDNSVVSWTGTTGNSISQWLAPTALRGTATCQIDWPAADAIPCEPVLLSDPVSSALGMWVGLLGISDLDHNVTSSDAVVLNRPDPISTGQVRQWETGTLNVLTSTLADRTELLAIMASGRTLLLRNPDPSYPENNWYLSCKGITEARVSPDHRFGQRSWQVPFTRVARPSGLIEASSETTWAAVATTWTWDELKASRATWLDVLTQSVDA